MSSRIAISAASTPGRSARSPVSAIGCPTARPSTMLSSSIGVSPGADRRIDRQIGELELAARDAGGRAAEREVRRLLGERAAVVAGQRERHRAARQAVVGTRGFARIEDTVRLGCRFRRIEDRPAAAADARHGALQERARRDGVSLRIGPDRARCRQRRTRHRAGSAERITRVPAVAVSRAIGVRAVRQDRPLRPVVAEEAEPSRRTRTPRLRAQPAGRSAASRSPSPGSSRSSAGCRSSPAGRPRARPG